MLGTNGKALIRPPKKQILTVVQQNCLKLTVKHFIEKPI